MRLAGYGAGLKGRFPVFSVSAFLAAARCAGQMACPGTTGIGERVLSEKASSVRV